MRFVFYMLRPKLKLWWVFAAMIVALAFTGIWATRFWHFRAWAWTTALLRYLLDDK